MPHGARLPHRTRRCAQFAALILYLLNGFVGMDYVTLFVVTVLLLACDFWTIKNVSGRLLVGLRWGTHVTETGQTEWYFLTHPVSR